MIKQIYLNTASICSKENLINNFNDAFELFDRREFNNLRNLISYSLHISNKITFSNNATQAFRNLIEFIQADKYNKNKIRILLSDLDHPVIHQASQLLSLRITELSLLDKILSNSIKSTKEITSLYIELIQNNDVDVVLIPHVDWISGTVFDIADIAKAIKSINSDIIIIVDGAQAMGNVFRTARSLKLEKNYINFYFSSGHKWLNSPIVYGFTSINSSTFKLHKDFSSLFIKDMFSNYAGKINELDQFNLDTYNLLQLSLIECSFLAIKDSLTDNSYFIKRQKETDKLKNIVMSYENCKILGAHELESSNFFSFSSDYKTLDMIHQKLLNEGFITAKLNYRNKNKRFEFIRVSSPIEELSLSDVKRFEKCIMI